MRELHQIPNSIVFSLLIVFATLLAGGCQSGEVSDRNIRFVSTVELNALLSERASEPDALVLIDPRSVTDFERVRLPGAVHIDLPEVGDRGANDPRIARYRTKVVYGQNPASAMARAMAKRLLSVGYEGVRLYQPGVEGWARAGMPVESSLEPSVPESAISGSE